jgi:poly-gamma-glutamate synthesis protein (capsule biosynthesis protein)
VNLEGVLLDEPPEGLPFDLHAMHAPLAIPILQQLNVKAASLANNHSFDLGANGLRETQSILRRSGIAPLLEGTSTDVGPFRLLALNFVGRPGVPGYPMVRAGDLDKICQIAARPPLIAFVQWGREYTNVTGPAEAAAAASLHNCGVSAIVGAHSHQAAAKIEVAQGGEYQLTYSLGNFLFDQSAARSSGALLEIRTFKQGTFATRLLPLPNFFELGNRLLRKQTLNRADFSVRWARNTEDRSGAIEFPAHRLAAAPL